MLCGAGAVLGVLDRAADGRDPRALRGAVLGARAGPHGRLQHALGRRRPGASRPRCCWRSCRGCRRADATSGIGLSSGGLRITTGTNRRLRLFAVTQIAASFVLLAGAGMLLTTLLRAAADQDRLRHANACSAINVPVVMRTSGRRSRSSASTRKCMRRIDGAARRRARGGRHRRAVARQGRLRPGLPVLGAGLRARQRRRGSARAVPHRLARLLRRARRADRRRAATSPRPTARDCEKVVIVSQSVARRMFPTAGRAQPLLHVDRPGDEVHRRQHRARAASSASRRISTTRTSCPGRR